MPNEVLVEGGARLRAVRKERGYTQERLLLSRKKLGKMDQVC